jgi:hypothetical protein
VRQIYVTLSRRKHNKSAEIYFHVTQYQERDLSGDGIFKKVVVMKDILKKTNLRAILLFSEVFHFSSR